MKTLSIVSTLTVYCVCTASAKGSVIIKHTADAESAACACNETGIATSISSLESGCLPSRGYLVTRRQGPQPSGTA
jgi:hypothetical protein